MTTKTKTPCRDTYYRIGSTVVRRRGPGKSALPDTIRRLIAFCRASGATKGVDSRDGACWSWATYPSVDDVPELELVRREWTAYTLADELTWLETRPGRAPDLARLIRDARMSLIAAVQTKGDVGTAIEQAIQLCESWGIDMTWQPGEYESEED